MLSVVKKFGSPVLFLFQVENVIFFAWITDSGSIYKVASHNCFSKKSKPGGNPENKMIFWLF